MPGSFILVFIAILCFAASARGTPGATFCAAKPDSVLMVPHGKRKLGPVVRRASKGQLRRLNRSDAKATVVASPSLTFDSRDQLQHRFLERAEFLLTADPAVHFTFPA